MKDKKILFIPRLVFEDEVFFASALAADANGIIIPEALYYKRGHGASITHNRPKYYDSTVRLPQITYSEVKRVGGSEDMALELSVYRRYKRRYPEFAEAIALGKASADYAVVRSLYKKATGYNVTLNKTYKLKRVDYDPETGKKIREYEELATGADETHVPADLRAETFWLRNRQSDRWSEKQEHPTIDGEGTGIVVIPEADMIDEEE